MLCARWTSVQLECLLSEVTEHGGKLAQDVFGGLVGALLPFVLGLLAPFALGLWHGQDDAERSRRHAEDLHVTGLAVPCIASSDPRRSIARRNDGDAWLAR